MPVDTVFLDTNYTVVNTMQYYITKTEVDKYTFGEKLYVIIGKEKHKDSMKEIFLCAARNMSEMFSKVSSEKSILDTVNLDERLFDSDAELGEPIMLEDIERSNRSYNCIKSCDIQNLRQMSNLTRKDLEGVHNLGKVSLNKIFH